MRTTCSAIALLILTNPAFAVDIDADSIIHAATVYPEGATVTRRVEFSSPAGSNRVIVDDLPLHFDQGSLRVTGAGDTAFSIVSVDHRIDRLPPTPEEDNPEWLRITGEIEALEDEIYQLQVQIRAHEADISVADTRLKMVEILMNREPQKMVDDVEYTRASPETWAQTISVLAQQSKIALAARQEAEVAIDGLAEQAADIEEDIAKKREELRAVYAPPTERSVATVELASDAAISGTLEISYRTYEAGWEPIYDLRLDQGDDATLVIERHARVAQQTGEDWTDVALTLSTAQPSRRMNAPDLPPAHAMLVFAQPLAERRSSSDLQKAPAPLMDGASAPSVAQAELFAREEDVVVENEPVSAVTGLASVELQGQTVIYTLPGTASVAGDGTVRQLGIDQGEVEADLLARATPEFDTNAYLYAAVENSFGGPILPGRASVFRDGTFIGESWLPMIAAGDEATLPFGVVDGITLTRHILEKEDGDYGIIGTTNRRVERFQLSAKSVLGYDLPLTIYDRVPFSEEEDLEITSYARPQPSETDVDGKRGVQAWTFSLSAGATQTIEFGYDIRWPGDQQMVVR